ncbi:MAG TPA: GAF domain-containing protein, partial [Spirochaetota bacterium]|nr:GAF domain-containing protein [Spirochaetota bacterium]
MRKIIQMGYFFSGHIAFIGIVSLLLIPVYYLGFSNSYFMLFGCVIVIVSLPILNMLYGLINRYLIDDMKMFLSPEKIDDVFQAQSVEVLMNTVFERMLSLLASRSGCILIHNMNGNSFDLYEQTRIRKKVSKNIPVDFNDPLLRALAENDEVIVKRKLNPKRGYDARLYDEFVRYDAEIASPIYYHDQFIGAFMLGGRSSRYTSQEIEIVHSFALKIGILFMNSFFWKESLEKKDIEREYELGKKVQENFYPPMKGTMGGYEYALSFKKSHGTFRQYCDLYTEYGYLSLSLFVNADPTPGSFVFLPSVIPLLHIFFRRDLDPSESVVRTMSTVVERGITDEPLRLANFRFRGKDIQWARTGYGYPLLFNLATEEAYFANDDGFAGECQMHRGLLFIVFDEQIHNSMNMLLETIVKELKLHKLESLQSIAEQIASAITAITGKSHLVGVFRVMR